PGGDEPENKFWFACADLSIAAAGAFLAVATIFPAAKARRGEKCDLRVTSFRSLAPDLHEFHSVSSSSVNLQDISNAWGVELVFEQIAFQGRGFLRFQAVVERPSWYRDGLGETECLREILG